MPTRLPDCDAETMTRGLEERRAIRDRALAPMTEAERVAAGEPAAFVVRMGGLVVSWLVGHPSYRHLTDCSWSDRESSATRYTREGAEAFAALLRKDVRPHVTISVIEVAIDRPAPTPDPLDAYSDTDLERIHFHLLSGTLTAPARDLIAVIEADALGSDRARNLLAALGEFDEAGPRTPADRRDHEKTFCRIAAVLVDAILADRAADPALVGELAASLPGGA